jgi:hypothetical protein
VFTPEIVIVKKIDIYIMDQRASLNLIVSSNSSYFDSFIRHCNILLTIAGLSFGLVPLQSAVLSGSSNNANANISISAV